jgi:hypothetical protein
MRKKSGALIYDDKKRNHVIWPGREPELKKFLDSTYKGMSHKQKNAKSSNSEDALTWSCFDVLGQVRGALREKALRELWEDSFGSDPKVPAPKAFKNADKVEIRVGKTYSNDAGDTEVDASLEGKGLLVFFEAKLYSTVSLKRTDRDVDQIAHKIRIGLQEAAKTARDFYFVFLDLAPREQLTQGRPKTDAENPKLTGYQNKWKSAYWFSRYKHGSRGRMTPLREILSKKNDKNESVLALPLTKEKVQQVADRMGWLTWADLFKIVLRAVVYAHLTRGQGIAGSNLASS